MAEALRWLDAFQGFARAAGPVFVASLWQGAMVAGGLALCLRLTPRVSAADRFRIWAIGFAALVGLPFLPYLLTVFKGGAESAPAASLADGMAKRAWIDLDPRWTLAIAAVWIVIAIYRVADLGVHTWRLRRLWKGAAPIALARPAVGMAGNVRAQAHTLQAEQHMFRLAGGGNQTVEVCTTRELDRPSVIGFLRPRILIPEWLFEKLTPAELEQVVLHEAAHLRRRDDWTNLVQKLALAVFPLNPALAWMERRLCREREMACDEAVVRATEKPRSYAACLTSLAERGLARRLQPEALSLGAWRRRPELAERVHRILRSGSNLPPAAARALLGVVGCGLLLGSVELARSPQVVAFVTPVQAQKAEMDATPARMTQTALAAGRMNGFGAMDAMVRTPETRRGRAGKARRSAARADEENASASTRPRFRSAPAEDEKVVAKGGAPVGAAPRQWVVFAAWEQVETASEAADTARGSSALTTQAAGQDDRAAAATPVAQQITFTRLVVIYPAAAVRARGAAGVKAGSSIPGTARPSVTGWPAAIPLRDGWLVFQL